LEVSERFNNGEPGPVAVVDGHEQFAVEYISAERMKKTRKELLVKWVGYKELTWILEDDVPVEIRAALWTEGLKYQ